MSFAGGITGPEPLGPQHVLDGFDCGEVQLDTWLLRYARQSHSSGGSRTRVVCQGARVVGFYSLAAGSVNVDTVPQRVAQGLGRHPVPVVVLTRLAVDRSVQGGGVGGGLLRDALRKVVEIADALGVRALMLNARDAPAKAWYLRQLPFQEGLVDPLELFLLFKDLRAAVR